MGLSDQFGAFYKPTDEQLKQAYTQGIVCFDANVLLDLYRLTPAARTTLLNLIEAIGDRIFVPYQVALEFHRNRARAVADHRLEIDGTRAQLLELLGAAKGKVRQLAARAYGNAQRAAPVEAELQAAFDVATAFADSAAEEFDLNEDLIVGRADDILDRLDRLLAGKVASKPSVEQLDVDQVEAARRNEAKEPPGFRDASKGDGGYGDYLWWAELVRFASSRPAPVLIVGNDAAKGDWVHTVRGIRIGLDPRLIDEVSGVTGHGVYLRSTSQFLEDGARLLGALVTPEAVNEARSIPRAHNPAQVVEYEDVVTITRLRLSEIEDMQSRGWLPAEATEWSWQDVRRAAILGYARKRGVSEQVLDRISDFTQGLRPPAHNVLVVSEANCEWVRSRELQQYLQDLREPPVAVIPLREFEPQMRTIQASLLRRRENDYSHE